MSDGPHKSLKLRRGWKQLAKRADKKAFAPEEVCDALPAALVQDWRAEVPEGLQRGIEAIFMDGQPSLFGDQKAEQLEALRPEAAGHPLAGTLLDCAIEQSSAGNVGPEGFANAAEEALRERAASGARQVEEHYRRESTNARAIHVRQRIEQGVMAADFGGITDRLIGSEKKEQRPVSSKQTGLDDGVRL